MNKKGQTFLGIVIFIGLIFLLLIIGVIVAFGGMVIDYVFDEAVPELTTVGVIGGTNISQGASAVLNPVNSFVQSFTWLSGVIFILGFLGILGVAMAFRVTGSKWLVAFFIICMFMLLIASIFISNIYQEFYTGTDDVASRLKDFELLSYMILYSPILVTIVGFIGGIIMFTGNREEGYGI